MTEWQEINLNDGVRVKLTDIGLAEFRRQREDLNATIASRGRGKSFPLEPTLDEDGYYCTQLWVLFEDYGHLIGLGKRMPFEAIFQRRA